MAVLLTVVMVLSVIVVPVAGAPPDNPGNGAQWGSNGNNGNSYSGQGDAGEKSPARGSNGNGQLGENANNGNSQIKGNSGNGDGQSKGNSANGQSQAVASSRASDKPGRSDEARPSGDAGNPQHAGSPDKTGPPEGTGPPDHAGPSVSVATQRPENPGPSGGQAGSPGRGAERSQPSAVEIAVSGVHAGDDVSIDASPPEVEDEGVAFDGISITVKRDGDFTMKVTNSRDPLPGSPAFESDDSAEALGRIRLDHSITNEEVEDVSFTFRVSKQRLADAGTDSEEVALYRFSDGEWTALTTDVIADTGTHYVFEAESPGMSEFAVGAKRPSFELHWAETDAETTAPGEPVTVSGRVSNVGSADGVYEASLTVDGEVVSTRQITVAAGGTRQVNFEPRFDGPNTYVVAIDGVTAGEVEVDDRPDESGSATVDRALSTGFELILGVGQSLRLNRLSAVFVP